MTAGVPLIGGSRVEEARGFQECLAKPGTLAPGTPAPPVPLSLTVLQVVQSLASAALIFLLLLAVKNRFKIK